MEQELKGKNNSFEAKNSRKIADGWSVGTPTVTTTIGQEGMTLGDSDWGGLVGNSTAEIVDHAVQLYTNEKTWNEAQNAGVNLVNQLFNKEKNGRVFMEKMEEIVDNLPAIRNKNIMGEVLR
jgi:glycosyltransferase involved in cell wall biosynthesis